MLVLEGETRNQNNMCIEREHWYEEDEGEEGEGEDKTPKSSQACFYWIEFFVCTSSEGKIPPSSKKTDYPSATSSSTCKTFFSFVHLVWTMCVSDRVISDFVIFSTYLIYREREKEISCSVLVAADDRLINNNRASRFSYHWVDFPLAVISVVFVQRGGETDKAKHHRLCFLSSWLECLTRMIFVCKPCTRPIMNIARQERISILNCINYKFNWQPFKNNNDCKHLWSNSFNNSWKSTKRNISQVTRSSSVHRWTIDSRLDVKVELKNEDDDEDDDRKELIIPPDDDHRSISSPLDLSTSDHFSSTSIKSDEEQQIPSTIQFQMEAHEGEPEDPNMAKVCRRNFEVQRHASRVLRSWKRWSRNSNDRRLKPIRTNASFANVCFPVKVLWKCTIAPIRANVPFVVASVLEPFRPKAISRLTWMFIV